MNLKLLAVFTDARTYLIINVRSRRVYFCLLVSPIGVDDSGNTAKDGRLCIPPIIANQSSEAIKASHRTEH